MGGIAGRAVKAGDRVPLGPSRSSATRSVGRANLLSGPNPNRRATGWDESPARVRILAGPQVEYFSSESIDQLQSAPYVISARSDRMGFRLDGPVLRHSRGADIVSDATPLGVLQVPASGQPILLMADRQTTGGYPKIATVITADMSVAGQLGPGDRISFCLCSPREAMAALIAQERALMAFERRP